MSIMRSLNKLEVFEYGFRWLFKFMHRRTVLTRYLNHNNQDYLIWILYTSFVDLWRKKGD